MPRIQILSPLLMLLAMSAQADDVEQTLTETLSTVYSECQFTGAKCLLSSEQALANLKPATLPWYEITLLRLDSLFMLRDDQRLLTATTELLKQASPPPAFLARVYVYHAKSLFGIGQPEQGKVFVEKAVELLSDIHAVDPNPITLIRLVNVQLYGSTNFEFGYQRLKALEKKFENRDDPIMKSELYSDLGHYASNLGLKNEALFYFQQATVFSAKTNNPYFEAISNFNVARVYSRHQLWHKASFHFAIALEFFQSLQDPQTIAESLLFLSESNYYLQDLTAAKKWFSQLNPSQLPQHRMTDFERIRSLINQPN